MQLLKTTPTSLTGDATRIRGLKKDLLREKQTGSLAYPKGVPMRRQSHSEGGGGDTSVRAEEYKQAPRPERRVKDWEKIPVET